MISLPRQLNQLKAWEQDLTVHEIQLQEAIQRNNPFEIEHHTHMCHYISKKILDLEAEINYTA